MTLTTRWIEIDAGGGERYDGYLALPRAGKGPGVIIVQEIFGVNAHVRSVAEQYALAGYVALAPDVFWRAERRVELGYVGPDRDKALALLKRIDANQAAADLGAAAQTLRALPETVGKIGAVGFCFGGQLAYLMAARGSVDAAVAYYGGGIQNKLDEADNIRVPGYQDPGDEENKNPGQISPQNVMITDKFLWKKVSYVHLDEVKTVGYGYLGSFHKVKSKS